MDKKTKTLIPPNVRCKPIIFSAESVRAILEGRKTQTRRCVPWSWYGLMDKPGHKDDFEHGYPYVPFGECNDYVSVRDICPYGRSGSLLWVRESWKLTGWSQYGGPDFTVRYSDGTELRKTVDYKTNTASKADLLVRQSMADCRFRPFPNEFGDCVEGFQPPGQGTRWRSSMFMPRWAARIVLKIESIRVEWLQDISEADAIAEGMQKTHLDTFGQGVLNKHLFEATWDHLNKKRGYPWQRNPFVWVISFNLYKNE